MRNPLSTSAMPGAPRAAHGPALASVARRLFLALAVGVVVLPVYAAVSVYTFAARDETRPADAAIVLGAAVYGNRPSPILRERINHAIALYDDGVVDYLIFTGGQGRTGAASEAEVAAGYAMARGVPAAAILLETTSTSTVENLTNAQQVATGHGLGRVLIVSTPGHMRRALSIAGSLGMDAYSSPTRSTRWLNDRNRRFFYTREVVIYTLWLADRLTPGAWL